MIADGDAEQDELGGVKVSKKRADAANVIGNMNDFWDVNLRFDYS